MTTIKASKNVINYFLNKANKEHEGMDPRDYPQSEFAKFERIADDLATARRAIVREFGDVKLSKETLDYIMDEMNYMIEEIEAN